MLNVDGLEKTIGEKRILANVVFSAEEGERLALFGPSGCGKTTLLRLIAGLDEAEAGVIRISRQTASDPRILIPPRDRQIGMVFQDLALWPHMTALSHVEFMLPSEVRGRSARRSRAAEILESVHLKDHYDRHPHELSGGEQQRLALARAIANDPKLLLLDEPFSSLDLDLREAMQALVRDIHGERKITIIYVSHIPEEVVGLAERVARMKDGGIQDSLSVAEFTAQYGTRVE